MVMSAYFPSVVSLSLSRPHTDPMPVCDPPDSETKRPLDRATHDRRHGVRIGLAKCIVLVVDMDHETVTSADSLTFGT